MIVKVCGITKGEQFNWLDEHYVDMVGLNFYPASKRYVGQFSNGMNTVPRTIKVGVFVNQDLSYILEKMAEYNLAMVQLHGNESPAFCNEVARHTPIIKAFGIDDDFSFADTEPYLASADYFLFDTKSATYGGSGKKFNWQKLAEYSFDTPFLLSGGICLDDIPVITNLKHKALAGIDVNSGFEIEPGYKDLEEINTMLKLIENNVSR
jgi:phosphoribosylanthranilate isomerase